MDLGFLGLDSQFLHYLVDFAEYYPAEKRYTKEEKDKLKNYRDVKLVAPPADVMEYPNSYVFIVDIPGLKSGDMKVQVEEEKLLLIFGERKRDPEKEKEGVKYVRKECRVGEFSTKFVLPENAITDAISAVCQDGVLTVTVQKLPPPEPKMPKTIEVQVV